MLGVIRSTAFRMKCHCIMSFEATQLLDQYVLLSRKWLSGCHPGFLKPGVHETLLKGVSFWNFEAT